jgi:hypothetical protein
MSDLEKERAAFLTEPDAEVEVASDLLDRKLGALLVEEREKKVAATTYGTFEARVGISASLAQMPALEALDPKPATFGADAEAGIDRIVALEKRLQKDKNDTYDASSPAADEDVDEPAEFGGLLDYLTKKGRAKKKLDGLRIKKAAGEEKQKILAEDIERKKTKKQVYTALTPSERLAYEASNPGASLPELQAQSSFGGIYRTNDKKDRQEKLRMKAIEKQTRHVKAYSALAPTEQTLFGHLSETVRLGPGASLQAVESAYKAMQTRSADLNYFGSLALGAALSKIRAEVESAAPALRGAALKGATAEFHAQAKTPMDASKATLFAHALSEYGNYVRSTVSKAAAEPGAKEHVAISMGECLADALLTEQSESSSWNANHPAVALTAVTDRLFQAVMHSAVPHDAKYVTQQVQSFWAADITPSTWKATAQKHFA